MTLSAGSHKPPKRLAICGGRPTFASPIHVGRPNLGSRKALLARIEKMLDRGYLTNSGPFEREWEQRLAEILGVRHCVAMSNATVALEIAIRALNLTGEVIVPSFTFVATAHALQWQQITPVFCDIDPRTHNIDPGKIEALISPRTTGILAVHLWGRPCAIDALQEIADRHGLELLFDAAHAFGCQFHGRKLGCFGRAEVLSFHATKFISAGEGGAVATNDDELAERMQLMKNFGFAGYDNVISIGTNGKMNELSAAMGLTHLGSRAEFEKVNRENYATYQDGLANIPGLKLLEYDSAQSPNYQYVVAEVDGEKAGLGRDHLIAALHAENVLARRYFYPGVHRMEPYRSLFPQAREHLPATEAVAARVMVLPTGTGVSAEEIEKICAVAREAVLCADEIHAVLDQRRVPALGGIA